MTTRRVMALLAVWSVAGCSGAPPSTPREAPAAPASGAPAAAPEGRTPPPSGPRDSAGAPTAAAAPESTGAGGEGPLEAETREVDPRSKTVKIKLWVTPVTAPVYWGLRKIGEAGRDPLEIERPRGSGPMDLIVKTAGFLPFHTRVYTDRDDRLTVRLVRAGAAPGVLGGPGRGRAAPDGGPAPGAPEELPTPAPPPAPGE